ncbi:MAG: hypothetical protein RLZZ488_2660 [Pseudomonadota bacterium]
MRIWNKLNRTGALFFTTVAGCTLTSFHSTAAFADAGGACHFHGRKEASEETVIRCSAHHRTRLSSKGKIDALWVNLSHESITKVTNPKGKQEWQVVFSNPTASDETKKKLFMFFTLNGNFVAANHTGK